MPPVKENAGTIALAGNPNVGKSTVFNALTGMRQHTGNWSGKTVSNARGVCRHGGRDYVLVDIPGCYSLAARSAEEEVARDIICSGEADVVAVVCAATCLERNLNLVLQIAEVTPKVIVCVNLLDEARRKGMGADLDGLSRLLGVPVVGTAARDGAGLDTLMDEAARMIDTDDTAQAYRMEYPAYVEAAVSWLAPEFPDLPRQMQRFCALRTLENGKPPEFCGEMNERQSRRYAETVERITAQGVTQAQLRDDIASAPGKAAAAICRAVTVNADKGYSRTDRIADRIFTGRYTAYPAMLLLLTLIFWITLTGANYPSDLLRRAFAFLEDKLDALLSAIRCPPAAVGALSHGVFRILGWVISVMLPPMAIFFPMFTLLEDLGYLPRAAFNMDHAFKMCGACGKQALTTCMGFGCNAAGVTGCRIIDSPRERLIAILTNSFVPCNGRFPTLAAMITMFLVSGGGFASSAASALLLAGMIVLGVLMTLAVSRLLSVTLLKGVPSAFTLELPPYRMPQWGQVIMRSLFDRTLFVLGRAAVTAAPAGLMIWLMANLRVSGETLLSLCSRALDAPAALMGLDGVILLAFILGFPANEIVIPIIIMAYTAQGTLTDAADLGMLHSLLTANGWTWSTGVCVMLFSLMHWPCSTTCITIFKETRSLKWTLLAIALPTACGALICTLFNAAAAFLTK